MVIGSSVTEYGYQRRLRQDAELKEWRR